MQQVPAMKSDIVEMDMIHHFSLTTLSPMAKVSENDVDGQEENVDFDVTDVESAEAAGK